MQLRGGLISIDEYLGIVSEKLTFNDRFDKDVSLSEMSLNAYNAHMINEFLNFYNRGAVTAAMLDIRLLELSNGTTGLREVFLELLRIYGKDKPFPEDEFFEVMVQMTYPEIEQFINDYILGAELLPYAEYMEKLGFKYVGEVPSEDTRPTMGFALARNENGELMTLNVSDAGKKNGVEESDVVLKFLGKDFNMQTARSIIHEIWEMNIGDTCDIIIKRNEEEIELDVVLMQRTDRHVFEEMENLTEEQIFLRDAWSRNL
jgi:predicted metalloprotease with PDZ domain